MDYADPNFKGTVLGLTVIAFFCALAICAEAFLK
jgi:hypothetical protein